MAAAGAARAAAVVARLDQQIIAKWLPKVPGKPVIVLGADLAEADVCHFFLSLNETITDFEMNRLRDNELRGIV